jgi:hypothetical protein
MTKLFTYLGRGLDSKLNDTALKNRTEVLRRYVDNIAYRELQLLYAVQALVTQRKHPKGICFYIVSRLDFLNVYVCRFIARHL